jgi:hypothetical protein
VLADQVGENEAALPSHQSPFTEQDRAVILDEHPAG